MPIQGLTRFRSHQWGQQVALNTVVAATRRIAMRGAIEINPNWTERDVDTGSIDPTQAPYRVGADVTASLTGELEYDHIPLLMEGGVRAGISPTGAGTAKTWAHQALSLTATALEPGFTDEWSDDVTTDVITGIGGVFESLQFGFDETLGPWTFTAGARFAGFEYPGTQTPGLTVAADPALVFGADTSLYIDDSSGSIGITPISSAMRGAQISINNTLDLKRYANGSNARFRIDGYGLSDREITATFRFEKTSAITGSGSEVADWLNANPQTRFLRVLTTSLVEAQAGIPYTWDQRFSGTWMSRADSEVGGNSIVELMLRARYSAALTYVYRSVVVGTRATAP